jgi:VanZ family protein
MTKYLHLLSRSQFKVVFFITVIFVLYKALSPNTGTPFFHFEHADKVLHASAFFVLSFLLNRASSSMAKRVRNMLSLLAFGILIEILQSFTGYREVSAADVLADLVGILFFQSTYSFLLYLRELKRKRRD